MDISSDERARFQTVEEWLLEYETGKPVMPGTLSKPVSTLHPIPILQHESHRTTRDARVVLAFRDIETGKEVVAFFNVDIRRQRGRYKGTFYRTGLSGQFNVNKRHKFYEFWMRAIGAEPLRWCRVHKEMKSKLKGLTFTGELSIGYDKDGSPYTQVKNLKILDTMQTQAMHKLDTNKTQQECTMN